jgi:hypothetical protein
MADFKAFSLKDLDNFPDHRKAVRKGAGGKFTLVVPRQGLRIGRRVIYRKERRIGVKFS